MRCWSWLPAALTRPLCLVQPLTPAQLSEVLQEVDNWQFDMFKLEQASNGHCLSLLAYHLFKRMDMIRQLHLSEMKLIR